MLEEFGLTKTEEKVYLCLLKLGLSQASKIIKKTQLHRTTIYDVLERLIEKGLVSSIIKDKVKHYSPINPSKLLDMANEEKDKAKEKINSAKEIIKELDYNKQASLNNPLAQIFTGQNGLKTIMDDILEQGEDFLEFGVEGKFQENIPEYTHQWANQRRKQKLKAKIIATQGSDPPIWKLNEVRFIPKEYQSPAATMIYKNKVAIFIQEEPLSIILIESPELSKSYRSYFEFLWKNAKKK